MSKALLRQLPSINKLIETADLHANYGRDLTTEALRHTLDALRQEILHHNRDTLPSTDQILTSAEQYIVKQTTTTLHGVINATGIVIHTNLGRATLSTAAQQAVSEAAASYSNLEFDIPSGKRGKRCLLYTSDAADD